MIGLGGEHTPKFARRYVNVAESISRAVSEYARDVRDGSFPADTESFHLPAELRDRVLAKHNK
jgi:3-methyl-2-oxobutanoate hydroxymethyltransferase